MLIEYEDQDLLVVCKPAGMNTIRTGKDDTECLHVRLEASGYGRLWVVHRLDKEVSGLVLFARHAAMHRYLNALFETRQVNKSYLALLAGEMQDQQGVVDLPLREFGSGRMGVSQFGGKPAITRYKLIEAKHGHSLVLLNPLTGRRHQLRVHLYTLGFPIAGDLKYGSRERQAGYDRLMLHATSLEFVLENGDLKHFESALPDPFQKILRVYGIGLPDTSLFKNQKL
ncbi:MAG TPA: RNA pseudouridine synthase [Bacteroidales bacterium]|nr:RNA pseudouridine synthase [Bacteroidales bacterium]HSA42841.1 RNA pseudouridine synthase [Bacteroidales bacterium]